LLRSGLLFLCAPYLRAALQRLEGIGMAPVLQARMNPYFLFNALNALAALARVAPWEVPRATGRLRKFLRALDARHD
jgi:LytS/YehU family sensor histidine kinase